MNPKLKHQSEELLVPSASSATGRPGRVGRIEYDYDQVVTQYPELADLMYRPPAICEITHVDDRIWIPSPLPTLVGYDAEGAAEARDITMARLRLKAAAAVRVEDDARAEELLNALSVLLLETRAERWRLWLRVRAHILVGIAASMACAIHAGCRRWDSAATVVISLRAYDSSRW